MQHKELPSQQDTLWCSVWVATCWEFQWKISTLKQRKMTGKNKWTHGQWAKIIWIKRVSSPWRRNQGSESGIILFSGEFSWFFKASTMTHWKQGRVLNPFLVLEKTKNVSVIWTLLLSHPGGGLGVVVDEKRSSVGSTADLPTSRQGARFSRGLRVCGGLRRLLRSRSRGWRNTLLHGGHRCSLLPS